MLYFCHGCGLRVAVDVSPDAPAVDRNEVMAMALESPARFVATLNDDELTRLRAALDAVEVREVSGS